jgi:hypothetical protein
MARRVPADWHAGGEGGNVEQQFAAALTRVAGRTVVVLPFDPVAVWGTRARFHVSGTLAGRPIRGALVRHETAWHLPVGPAWLRDTGLVLDVPVPVALQPEGPQADALEPDMAAALAADDAARSFFEALPTFYRKNFVRWILSAKQPQTRAARIAEWLQLLRAGQRER